jgi:hypothetical protein
MPKEEDYNTLDVEVGASVEDITAAYRDLVAVWHPDNFAHSPRLQAKAEEKMRKIRMAYERLCGLEPSGPETRPDDSRAPAQSMDGREAAEPPDQNPFPTRPVTEWVGERLVFLNMEICQEYGYMSVRRTKDQAGDALPYREYVGRVAKVTRVEPSEYIIRLVLEDTGEKVYGTVSRGVIEDMALVADIENARALYVGETLWTGELVYTHVEGAGEKYLDTPAGFFPVTVIDVVPGWDEERPVRFVVRIPSGEEGYIDVQMSETNLPPAARKYNIRFEEVFRMENPDDE